jgi:hypothetical protein
VAALAFPIVDPFCRKVWRAGHTQPANPPFPVSIICADAKQSASNEFVANIDEKGARGDLPIARSVILDAENEPLLSVFGLTPLVTARLADFRRCWRTNARQGWSSRVGVTTEPAQRFSVSHCVIGDIGGNRLWNGKDDVRRILNRCGATTVGNHLD